MLVKTTIDVTQKEYEILESKGMGAATAVQSYYYEMTAENKNGLNPASFLHLFLLPSV